MLRRSVPSAFCWLVNDYATETALARVLLRSICHAYCVCLYVFWYGVLHTAKYVPVASVKIRKSIREVGQLSYEISYF